MPLKSIGFLSGNSGNFLPLFDVSKKNAGRKNPGVFFTVSGRRPEPWQIQQLTYFSRASTVCGCWLACASIAVAAC